MRRILAGVAAVASLTLAVAAPAQAATVLNVGWNEGCSKATCFDDQGRFTQTFSAAAFNGPVTIGQLLLERAVLGSLDGKTFRLSFTLNGEEIGAWGSFTMGGIGGDELSFTGENFVWNPQDGDLLLVLAIAPPAIAGVGGFFSAFGGGGAPDDAPGEGDAGLQARLAAPVPEPAAWALMISGFGLAGATLRRRRAVVLAQP